MKTLSLSIAFASLFIMASILSCGDKNEEMEDIDKTVEEVNSDLPPNIIFIVADDMGWDAFGKYPGITSTKAITPSLDSLAQNGLTFTNFWVNPICAPTRAAMLTGKYAFRTGVGGVKNPQEAALSSSETLIQKHINDQTSNEYATAVIGKWHVSFAAELNAPDDFGIDYYSGIHLGAVPDYYDWTQTSGGTQQNITTYATTHFVDQSIDWIGQQSKPFFIWLAFNAPHTPFHRPPLELISDKSLSDNQSEIDNNPLPYYLASIEAMDTEIARLITSLTPEQKENTLFVFLGDNGTPPSVAQAPFGRTKSKNTLYQGGVNTPLIVSGKGVSRKNEVETALVQAPDMFATLADIAGAGGEKHEDGISIKPLFTDADASKRTYTYTEQFENNNPTNDGYTLRNEQYKFIQLSREDDLYLLFDLVTDPFEENDLLEGNLSSEAQSNFDALKAIKDGIQ